ncbi:MAG: cupin domain-containing protein [bacterium]|nr:cupin domain-containing protein [bacterium]
MGDEKIYRGKYAVDALEHKGWLVGHFLEFLPRKTSAVEIKHWHFPRGATLHEGKWHKTALEITFLLKGRIKGTLAGEEIEMNEGDYVVIHPGVENNFPTIVLSEFAEGIAVKAPSVRDDIVR